MAPDDIDDLASWRRPGWFIAAGFLAALVAVGLVVGVISLLADDPTSTAADAPPAPPTVTADPTVTTTPGESEQGIAACPPLDDSDQTIPVVAPDAQWELVYGIPTPTAEAVGPARTDPVRSCFARTPSGALLASFNFLTTLNAVSTGSIEDLDEYRRVVLSLTADTTGQGRYSTLLSQAAEQDVQGLAGTVTPVAYQFIDYTGGTAQVAVVSDTTLVDSGDSVLLRLDVSLRWDADSSDWRAIVPESGRPTDLFSSVDSTRGFVPWSPSGGGGS